jgi:ferredoxin
MGVDIKTGFRMGRDASLAELKRDWNAVIIAVGEIPAEEIKSLGLEAAGRGVKADIKTMTTGDPAVFATGAATRPGRIAVRSVADGHAAAESVDQFLRGAPVTGLAKEFNSRAGKLSGPELAVLAADAATSGERRKATGESAGYAPAEAEDESGRCMHCDCLRKADCRLRDYSTEAGAEARYDLSAAKSPLEVMRDHPQVIFESGKCIKCGLCVRICQVRGEPVGMAFTQRGILTRVGPPYGATLKAAMQVSAIECAKTCPTGALAVRKG